ncbi:Kinesin-like protein [Pseudomonas syringae pv. actinidiae]|uniref:Kinesin-like protein n=1 Tax=Pseudomonas syringae pv. actinidiae TaxID=103796 RepID=A0A2V0QTQ2_PSESF|nr:Kinesin-like protein [Pseudomonas syringae pv. actinidiae]
MFTFDTRHAGRVAEHGAGIVCGRGATCKAGAHAADALFVEGEAGSEQLRRSQTQGESKSCPVQCFCHYFHY